MKEQKAEERQAKLAESQLRKENMGQNSLRSKAPAKELVSIAPAPILASSEMPNLQKSSVKASTTSESLIKTPIQAVEEVVATSGMITRNRAGRKTKRPSRYT
ncbi:hypothetical protein B0O99DRAFT_615302 [Bisporella sp. PMI_857]|nr:hypothetical protein B0O99DRAFT_615302 [Bisporella sp. PMI_857]